MQHGPRRIRSITRPGRLRFSGRACILLSVWSVLGLLAASAKADYASTVVGDHPTSYWRLNDSSPGQHCGGSDRQQPGDDLG
jgi:hypothetical protein